MQLHRFSEVYSMNQHFSEQIALILQRAIEERGCAYLVVSGGKTPRALFVLLSHVAINWSLVTIILADERDVATTSEDSNEYLVKTYFLQNQAAKAHFIGLRSDLESRSERFIDIQTKIAALPQCDIVILGLGEDGHTASLFPGSQGIFLGLSDHPAQDVVEIIPTEAPFIRFSLTKKRLQNTRHLFLHIIGQTKLSVLYQAEALMDANKMPICAFMGDAKPELQVMFAPC